MEGPSVAGETVCARCGRSSSAEASFCASCGARLGRDAAPHEERKLVSILFVDLEGFTASSEAADPEDVRDALARYHTVARERIEAYGGTVEKFIGDAVMAVFGAPIAHGDDAERAVRAGLRVLEAVEELRDAGLALAARAAVNTGDAIVSVVRREAGEALAIGDVVNTAARLQSAAPVGRLVVGAETRRATRHAIAYEPLPAVVAKGKAAPVETWCAVGPISEPAERAVRAGLRVLEAVEELSGQGFALAARAAVNTGEAIVSIDRRDSGEALAIGDVVNTAARLQSAAPVGRLVVGTETRRATRHAIAYEPLPAVVAKGKAAPVETWCAVGPISEPAERPGTTGPFVGRRRELDVIRSVWRQATLDRRPQVVTVVGPPGMGKSRLAREIAAEVEASAGRVIRGRCLPYEEQTGYHASAQLVRQAFGIFDSDAQHIARAKLDEGVTALLPASEAADTARYLALLLGLGMDAPVLNQRLLFLALRRVIERLGEDRPTLVVFEDIHWAAASELDLLEYLGSQLRATSALVMALTRPELLDARPWGARLPAHTSIALDPLTSEETRELATGLVVDTGDAGVDVERLVSLSDGNPLFVEELTAAIADGASGSGLPVTVTAAIAARLDVLPPSLRTVLFSAAVVGRTFWRDVVAAIADERTVDDALDELERRDLVRREHDSRLEGDVEYRFRHALIQDVAYATLTRVERAARHADVARYIEQRVGTEAGPVAWILAHHWRSAGDPARAVPHLLAAAEVAERGWATREVVELYSLAAELADDDETRARIRLRRGMALKALDADHEAAAELAAVLPELRGAERLDGLLYAGRAEIWSERHEEALRYGEQALAFAEELDDADGRVAALALVSDALAQRGEEGDLDRALALGDEALEAWPPGVRGYEHADHLHLQADVKYWTGDYRGSAACAVRAREVAGDVQSAHALLRGGGIDAMASVGLGRHEEALEKLDAIMALARELGESGAYLPNYRSVVYREVLDLESARDASRTALEASRDLTFGMPRRFALSDLLQADLLAGDVGRAQADWPALWEDASKATGWTRWLIFGRLAVARAEIALRAEAPEVAAGWAAKAVEITARTRRRKYEAMARTYLGSALVAAGRRNEGLAELRSAVAIADSLVNPAGRWRPRAAAAEALRSSGAEEEAVSGMLQARTIVMDFAATLAPGRARTLLAAPAVREVLDTQS